MSRLTPIVHGDIWTRGTAPLCGPPSNPSMTKRGLLDHDERKADKNAQARIGTGYLGAPGLVPDLRGKASA